MDLIKTNLKRARDAKNPEQKDRREADILWNIRGIISVWADTDGIRNKSAYALELLQRIQELNSEFKEDSELRMDVWKTEQVSKSPAMKKLMESR
jgi:hypothetical protein